MVLIWAGFILFVILLLLLDLCVLNRRPRAIAPGEAVRWSVFWIGLGAGFSLIIFEGYSHHRMGLGLAPDLIDGRPNTGSTAAVKYLTGFVLEKALSVDNLFVMAVIFRFLAVPIAFQHRVLLWGILGAMALRGGMIGVGVELIRHYNWVMYLFGGFLLLTGLRLLFPEPPPDPARNPVLNTVRRIFPVTTAYHGPRFTAIEKGRRMLTPLALALLLIESADAVFAVDSIPAVFSVTADPLLVFTSNIMAVLGLRSLYSALAGMIEKFRHLKFSLALILAIVGAKMIAGRWAHLLLGEYADLVLLGVIGIVLAAGALASIARPEPAAVRARRENASEPRA